MTLPVRKSPASSCKLVNRERDGLEQVPQAHDDMEHDRATGKLVVRVRH